MQCSHQWRKRRKHSKKLLQQQAKSFLFFQMIRQYPSMAFSWVGICLTHFPSGKKKSNFKCVFHLPDNGETSFWWWKMEFPETTASLYRSLLPIFREFPWPYLPPPPLQCWSNTTSQKPEQIQFSSSTWEPKASEGFKFFIGFPYLFICSSPAGTFSCLWWEGKSMLFFLAFWSESIGGALVFSKHINILLKNVSLRFQRSEEWKPTLLIPLWYVLSRFLLDLTPVNRIEGKGKERKEIRIIGIGIGIEWN